MRDPNVARGYVYHTDQQSPLVPTPSIKYFSSWFYVFLTALIFAATLYVIGV